MDRFIVMEIGSTTSKGYLYDKGDFSDLGLISIEFKKNYKINNMILEEDKEKLYDYVAKLKTQEKNIFVYGTSIFRNLNDEERKMWLKEFKQKTSLDFNIVSADQENAYTVYGTIKNIPKNDKVAIMVGGGGSTELSIVHKGQIIEAQNYPFGAQDITDAFPELATDKVTSEFEDMISYAHNLIPELNNKADYLILAGGDYLTFYQKLKFPMERNGFYEDKNQPYMIDNKTMELFDKKFFYEMSLNQIIKENGEALWWKNTRGMRICVTTIVRLMECKYIIPTRIGMLYGIVEEILKGG